MFLHLAALCVISSHTTVEMLDCYQLAPALILWVRMSLDARRIGIDSGVPILGCSRCCHVSLEADS